MDAEDVMWLTLVGVMSALLIALALYVAFFAIPENNANIALCEQAGGFAVTDDGAYRFCVDSRSVIQIDQADGVRNAD